VLLLICSVMARITPLHISWVDLKSFAAPRGGHLSFPADQFTPIEWIGDRYRLRPRMYSEKLPAPPTNFRHKHV
jgi:hypothetical protein